MTCRQPGHMRPSVCRQLGGTNMSQRYGLGPNKHLIGVEASRAMLATPALLLDLDALEANIARMAELIRPTGLQLRPHAKTHKSIAIARMQIEAGAVGICV